MLTLPVLEAVLLVLLGGLFGWVLGQLPRTYVYVVMAATILLGIVVLSTTKG